MERVTLKDKTYILFLTGNEERVEFDSFYDFELAQKEAEKEGNGFKCWIEAEHNNELLVISIGY